MPSHMTAWLCVGFVALLATPVAAGDKGEFAFNLFSDIAPILALFGEQFAKQFASESLTWVDNLIFAMVPLGIVATITGAIRVQGSRTARAFIGKARENRALAELELMSSTSGEVCELFNGKSVVRAMGQPSLAQYVLFPDRYEALKEKYKDDFYDEDDSCGIHTLGTAVDSKWEYSKMNKQPFHSKSYTMLLNKTGPIRRALGRIAVSASKVCGAPSKSTKSFEERIGKLEDAQVIGCLGAPNLQLNLSFDPEKSTRMTVDLIVAGILSTCLQASLIIVAAVTAYYPPTKSHLGSDIHPYGFPCYSGGSILLVIGMWICAHAIQRNTVEFAWTRMSSEGAKTRDEELASRSITDVEVRKEIANGEKPAKRSLDEAHIHDRNRVRIFWLQHGHRVSDQTFLPFVILGGMKDRIITSTRIEEFDKILPRSDGEENSPETKGTTENEGGGGISPHEKARQGHDSRRASREGEHDRLWEYLTILAVLSSILGFVSQFIGLRGLPWPVSVAHLLAVFAMALIRGYIRRGQGQVDLSCEASRGYELDFLAINLCRCASFRHYSSGGRRGKKQRKEQRGRLKDISPANTYCWGIKTRKYDEKAPFYVARNPPSPPERSQNSAENEPEISKNNNLSSNEAVDHSKDKTASSNLSGGPVITTIPLPQYCTSSTKPDGSNTTEFAPLLEIVDSRQLLRVRQRLSSLSPQNASSASAKVSDAACALGKSIEAFMRVFCRYLNEEKLGRVSNDKRRVIPCALVADIKKVELDGTSSGTVTETITVHVSHQPGPTSEPVNDAAGSSNKQPASENESRWTVNSTKLDAILSLWMSRIAEESRAQSVAKLDSRNANARDQKPRRLHKGRIQYCRILGETFYPRADNTTPNQLSTQTMDRANENTLKRDISWWIDESIALESEGGFEDGKSQHGNSERAKHWVGSSMDIRTANPKTKEADKLVIGFTGLPQEYSRQVPSDHSRRELSIHSEGNLPYVLAQHLFTSFVWTVAELLNPTCLQKGLPESHQDAYVVGERKFDAYRFEQTWLRPKLGHPRLDRLVQDIERAGLGSPTEALLCIIPAFSALDLLPNEIMIREVQKRANESEERGPSAVAGVYLDLLQTPVGFTKREHYSYAVITTVLEFLFHCCEPFRWDAQSVPAALSGALKDLVDRLLHEKLVSIIESLLPIYHAQKRQEVLGKILAHCASSNREEQAKKISQYDYGKHAGWHSNPAFAEKLQIPSSHIKVFQALEKPPSSWQEWRNDLKKSADVVWVDIFGWTALHYASISTKENICRHVWVAFQEVFAETKSNRPLHTLRDKLQRSPIHTAAQSGKEGNLVELLKAFDSNKDEKRTAILAESTDMTLPLHLASAAGSVTCVQLLLEDVEYDVDKCVDIWSRSVVHIAAMAGKTKVLDTLLKAGFNSSTKPLDKFRKTPLAYFLDQLTDDISQEAIDTALKLANSGDPNKKIPISRFPGSESVKAVLRKGLLTAAQIMDLTESGVEDTDSDGLSILHHAVDLKDTTLVKRLILELKAPTRARDPSGRTPLHRALDREDADTETVEALIEYAADSIPDICVGLPTLVVISRRGSDRFVAKILEASKEIINLTDTYYDQTALSWACEFDHVEVVKALLACPDLDVNKSATRWKNWTPLHFAAAEGAAEVVKTLLWSAPSNLKLDVEPRDQSGRTPLDLALVRDEPLTAAPLFLDPRATRIKSISSILSASEDTKRQTMEAVKDLQEGQDAQDALALGGHAAGGEPADELTHPTITTNGPWFSPEFLKNGLEELDGKEHEVDRLILPTVNPSEFDDDNWSCIDVAASYGREKLENVLMKGVPPSRAEAMKMPSDFNLNPITEGNIQSHNPTDDGERKSFIQLSIKKPSEENSRATVLANHPIPPRDSYYFEARIVENSKSGIFGIGICSNHYDTDAMPGWYGGSWGYHGDDGALFLESGSGSSPPGTVSAERKRFGKGDVVGCGVNMERGTLFFTLNRNRLVQGSLVNREALCRGKLYPCVGMSVVPEDVGLRVEVDFSATYPEGI